MRVAPFKRFFGRAYTAADAAGPPPKSRGANRVVQRGDRDHDFDGLHKWHPMFADDMLKSGANDEIGSVRTITIKDGPSFDEELLSFDALEKQFRREDEGRRGHRLHRWRVPGGPG